MRGSRAPGSAGAPTASPRSDTGPSFDLKGRSLHPSYQNGYFHPPLADFTKERSGTVSTVLSGSNNSGKSLVLKHLRSTMGKTAYMVGTNRFYHVYHFSTGLRDPNQLDQFENNFQNNLSNEQHNLEQNPFELGQIVISLSDTQRQKLFDLTGELIGGSISLKRVDEHNDLSPRYIDIDGQNLSVSSTGTRLLMTLLGICMDDRFKTILVDEPELGLSPRIQRSLAELLHDGKQREATFPHLKQVVLATHSQHFLNRTDLSANYVVSKSGSDISLERITDIARFHQLQFNLLGNSLDALFLPSAIVYVEGQTDQKYIERITSTRFPTRNVVIVRAGSDGEIKQRLYALKESLGDLQKSPLRQRIFVVVDSTHSRGLKDELVSIGLEPSNFIAWKYNGIEFVYPSSVMSTVFGCTEDQLSNMVMIGDTLSLNGITLTKNALCDRVLAALRAETALPEELVTQPLDPLAKAIDASWRVVRSRPSAPPA
jgi:predicted ATPase